MDKLLANRTHRDAGVRYWTANGLLIRAASENQREEILKAARSMLIDPSPYVRCLTNETLARYGNANDRASAIRSLVELANPDRHNLFVGMLAMNSLDWCQPTQAEIGQGLVGLSAGDKRVGARYQSYMPRLVERIESISRP